MFTIRDSQSFAPRTRGRKESKKLAALAERRVLRKENSQNSLERRLATNALRGFIHRPSYKI